MAEMTPEDRDIEYLLEQIGGTVGPTAGAITRVCAAVAALRAERDALARDYAALVALGERLRTQDNQMTAHPIFVVEHRSDARRPWEFVTACLTDEGAHAYMHANGHNLRKFRRIFVQSGYRNDQWIGLRNHLMALPAATPVTDTTQGNDVDDDPTEWFPSPDARCITCGHLKSVHLAKRGRCLSLNAVEGGSVPCACDAFVVDMVDALRAAHPLPADTK